MQSEALFSSNYEGKMFCTSCKTYDAKNKSKKDILICAALGSEHHSTRCWTALYTLFCPVEAVQLVLINSVVRQSKSGAAQKILQKGINRRCP